MHFYCRNNERIVLAGEKCDLSFFTDHQITFLTSAKKFNLNIFFKIYNAELREPFSMEAQFGEIQMKDLRQKAFNRTRAKKLLFEILFNMAFLFVLFMNSYTFRQSNAFHYQISIRNLFLNNDFNKVIISF